VLLCGRQRGMPRQARGGIKLSVLDYRRESLGGILSVGQHDLSLVSRFCSSLKVQDEKANSRVYKTGGALVGFCGRRSSDELRGCIVFVASDSSGTPKTLRERYLEVVNDFGRNPQQLAAAHGQPVVPANL